ncbi:flavodoxin domain-containing protein [Caproiciproducens sp. CPB-2]|uniref:flavodoxin domain-containing protein n=1 Tax=Caproiciproducens sp. CPB-2 TaxID=3030017 RepID=UPI0023DB99F7|nr:flavodoxin domain-containing protein [Caproiciproducens sp. CPB-2]MDF1494935.1 flavodoxin domain-containing protein [Caproiciproducens sp. CPB-2]
MMKTTAVIYRSKSGFTEKYARWIAEEADADLLEADGAKLENLLRYGTIVYGGGLYVGGINGVKLITGHMKELADKKLIVFGVGASPCRPNTVEEVRRTNFSKEAMEKIHFFLLRGGFDLNKCNLKDKMLMNLLKVKLEKAPETDEDAKGMLACYDHPADFTSRDAIRPILDCIKKYAIIKKR